MGSAGEQTVSHPRAASHKDYIDSLQRPSAEEIGRISKIQERAEAEIKLKYHTAEEHDAATVIQKAYRGHRERRQLDGLTLDPSSRWVEVIKEYRYRKAIAPHLPRHDFGGDARSVSPADRARMNWKRVGQIAEHAGAGESNIDLPNRAGPSAASGHDETGLIRSAMPASSMLLDLRYFLEMIDSRHRYGANLQVYHEEWLKSDTKQSFFDWLDHGEGRGLDLPGCSRDKLDRECIRYLSKEERQDYLVDVDDDGKLRWAKNRELITTSAERYRDSIHGIVPRDADDPDFSSDPTDEKVVEQRRLTRRLAAIRDGVSKSAEAALVSEGESDSGSATAEDRLAQQVIATNRKPKKHHITVSPATILNHLLRATVKPGTWIYVSDTMGRLYVGIKSSGSFQHTSFLAGARISSAGSIGIDKGQLLYLSPLSGHYRPTTKSFKAFVDNLKNEGADLSQMRVSKAYQILWGMEYYGKAKTGLHKLLHHERKEYGRARSRAKHDTRESGM